MILALVTMQVLGIFLVYLLMDTGEWPKHTVARFFAILLVIFWELLAIIFMALMVMDYLATLKFEKEARNRTVQCFGPFEFISPENGYICTSCGFHSDKDSFDRNQVEGKYQHEGVTESWKKYTTSAWYKIFLSSIA